MEPTTADAFADLRAACRLVPGVPVPEAVPVVDTATTDWIRAAHAGDTVDVIAERLRAGTSDNGTVLATVMAHAQGLSYAVAGPTVAGALRAGVAMDVEPERLWLGFGRGGFCERVATDHWRLRAAPPGRFEDRAAEQITRVLEPAFEAVPQWSRVGRRVVWSALPDSVALIALTAALAGAHPATPAERADELRRAWSVASALIDALAARVPSMSARPREVTFGLGDGRRADEPGATWMVRGGCCFMYRLGEGAGYCVTCPVLDEHSRQERLRRWAGESSLWRCRP